jgi:hypothetical protein
MVGLMALALLLAAFRLLPGDDAGVRALQVQGKGHASHAHAAVIQPGARR